MPIDGVSPAAIAFPLFNFALRTVRTGFELKSVPTETTSLLETISQVTYNIKNAKDLRKHKAHLLDTGEIANLDHGIKSAEDAMGGLEALVEPARVDMATSFGRVGAKSAIMWVVRDAHKVEAALGRLTVASQILQTQIIVVSLRSGQPVESKDKQEILKLETMITAPSGRIGRLSNEPLPSYHQALADQMHERRQSRSHTPIPAMPTTSNTHVSPTLTTTAIMPVLPTSPPVVPLSSTSPPVVPVSSNSTAYIPSWSNFRAIAPELSNSPPLVPVPIVSALVPVSSNFQLRLESPSHTANPLASINNVAEWIRVNESIISTSRPNSARPPETLMPVELADQSDPRPVDEPDGPSLVADAVAFSPQLPLPSSSTPLTQSPARQQLELTSSRFIVIPSSPRQADWQPIPPPRHPLPYPLGAEDPTLESGPVPNIGRIPTILRPAQFPSGLPSPGVTTGMTQSREDGLTGWQRFQRPPAPAPRVPEPPARPLHQNSLSPASVEPPSSSVSGPPPPPPPQAPARSPRSPTQKVEMAMESKTLIAGHRTPMNIRWTEPGDVVPTASPAPMNSRSSTREFDIPGAWVGSVRRNEGSSNPFRAAHQGYGQQEATQSSRQEPGQINKEKVSWLEWHVSQSSAGTGPP